jgi:hypothetical protein
LNQLCVLCGEEKATTKDHIPPQGIYPKPRPNNINLHTVPACSDCNNGAGIEDEQFKILISFETGEYRENQYEVIDWMAKTVGANQKIANKIFETRKNGFAIRDEKGIEPVVSVEFDGEKYNKVIERIVKALYWRQTGNYLGKHTNINVFPKNAVEPEFLKNMKLLMDTLEPHKLNSDTFIYKITINEDGTSIWAMQFFGKHTVFAYADAPKHNK